MSLRVTIAGKVKHLEVRSRSESESEQGAAVGSSGRETVRSTHGQVEAVVTHSGGPNPLTLKSLGMTCG